MQANNPLQMFQWGSEPQIPCYSWYGDPDPSRRPTPGWAFSPWMEFEWFISAYNNAPRVELAPDGFLWRGLRLHHQADRLLVRQVRPALRAGAGAEDAPLRLRIQWRSLRGPNKPGPWVRARGDSVHGEFLTDILTALCGCRAR